MKIQTVLFGLLGLSLVARADLTQIEVDNAYFAGVISCFPMPNPTTVTSGEGGSGMNMIPVSYAFGRKSNLEQPAGFNTSISIEQTKIYVIETNRFSAITPRTIVDLPSVSKLPGSDTGTNANESDVDGKFFRAFTQGSMTRDEYRFGRYRLRVQINVNNTGWVTILEHGFIVSPLGVRDAQGQLDDPVPGGGGISPEDLDDQNVNKGSFWENILSGAFVPQQENLDVLRDTLAQWGTWGPFGIINYLRTRIADYGGTPQMDYTFSVDIPFAGVTTFDLSPYETFIKIQRVFQAMGLWTLVVLGMWKKVYAKV